MVGLTSVLIGCGAIAREHLAAIKDLNDVRVTAVCDLSAARAEATAERFGIERWYTDYEKLLADCRPRRRAHNDSAFRACRHSKNLSCCRT